MLPGETVTILRPVVVTDGYGNETADWTQPPASTEDVPDVLCEPRPSGEPLQDARNQVTSGFTLYLQTVPTILPTPVDRVTVRGVDYQVEGETADWRLGSMRGLVVQTTRTEG